MPKIPQTDDSYDDSEGGGSSEESGQQTALIPKKLCPDMKVGDKVILKIVAGHDDDWEVVYPGEHDDEAEEAAESQPSDTAGSTPAAAPADTGMYG
jgi:hypothetical protein